MKFLIILSLCIFQSPFSFAKEVALSFDDAPNFPTFHFQSEERTLELIRKLKSLKTPPVMVFANACKENSLKILKHYKDAGHLIENHTCSHPRLDEVGYEKFAADAEKGDKLLTPLFSGQKFFRFPYLNEGKDLSVRNKMRQWLKDNNYRNGSISGDNEDPTFSAKINEAKKLGKKINYSAVEKLFLNHILKSLECNNDLAIKHLGRSPKHVLLLHEADATIMFIHSLVKELRQHKWEIINPTDAYSDPMYNMELQNTHSGLGIVSQIAFEKTGQKVVCYDYSMMVKELNRILELKD